MNSKYSYLAVVTLAVSLGLLAQSVRADEVVEAAVPDDQEVEQAIQILIEKGLVRIDPDTGEAIIQNDLLELLGDRSRVKEAAGREGTVCRNDP